MYGSADLEFNNKWYAVVTGGNKGIGFEICRQLASEGIMVILTARDTTSGIEAQEKLRRFGLSDHVVLHQLDVMDPASISSLVTFIELKYKKLDILVNNAGISGIGVEGDISCIKQFIDGDMSTVLDGSKPFQLNSSAKIIQTFEDAEKCVQTNYYGAKTITEAFIPLLQSSDSPRIVNVSSILGNLKLMANEWAKGVLSNAESLTVEKLDEVVKKFLESMTEGSFEANGWPSLAAAYKVSKAAMNGYTRIMAKKYPNLCINSICPGFVGTDMTAYQGSLTNVEGAASPVKLALLPYQGPSGSFFYRKDVFAF